MHGKDHQNLLKESSDVYLTLLSYRATPLPPMGRRLCTDVPQVSNLLIPDWPHLLGFQEKNAEYKKQQKEQNDRCHRARAITTLPEDTKVWVTLQDRQVPGRVLQVTLLLDHTLLMYQLAK